MSSILKPLLVEFSSICTLPSPPFSNESHYALLISYLISVRAQRKQLVPLYNTILWIMGYCAIQFICPLDPLILQLHPSVCQKAGIYGLPQWTPWPQAFSLFLPLGVTSKKEENGKRMRIGNYSLFSFPCGSRWIGIFFHPSAESHRSHQVALTLSSNEHFLS